MADFATPEQMGQRTQGAIAATHPFLAPELAAATQAIRDYCGWHIAPREEKTMRRVGPRPGRVWIPAMAIASIDEVIADGESLDPLGIEFDPDTGWTSLCARSVSMKFTAGFTQVPASLVALTLELAAGALGSPIGISREQAGGVAVTFTRTSGALLVGPGGADVARLAAYKLGWLP